MEGPSTHSPISSIDRKPSLSRKEFIEHYEKKGIPVIIPGAMQQWKAFEKWEPTYFQNQLGNKSTRINGKSVRLGDFMDTVLASNENKPSAYLNEVNIHKDFPELLSDITPHLIYALPDRLMSNLIPKRMGMRNGIIELLIGGKGTKFPTLHFDGYHMNTFITQIRGDKEFILYDPTQTRYMYPNGRMGNHSQVNDVYKPDLDKFPLFAKAKPIKVIVKQGDTVFLPSGWWHTTRLLSLSIAVSTNSIGPLQWNAFVNDYLPELTTSKVKQNMYKTYFMGAGLLMSVKGE